MIRLEVIKTDVDGVFSSLNADDFEELLYQGTDPDGKFKAILKYSYPVKDSDLKKFSMELLSAGERKTAPVHHINRNQGMER